MTINWENRSIISRLCAQGDDLGGPDASDGLTDRLAKRQKRAWEEGSSDEEDAAERQRAKDQEEKEEFEARLKARDEAKTRKIAEARLSKEEVQVSTMHMCH